MINEKEFLSALKGLLRINSVKTQPVEDCPFGAGPARALKYTLDLARGFGFTTKNCDGMVGYAEIGEGEEMVGVLAHLDTVDIGDESKWLHPAFDLTEDDGVLYGRGVIDDKGPAMAALFAMKEIKESGIPLRRRIRLILGQTEESGEWTDMQYYCDREELPTLGFTPDGNFPVIYGEKGILALKLHIPENSGIKVLGGTAQNVVPERCEATLPDGSVLCKTGTAAHGSMPWLGENAVSKVMAELGDRSDISRFYNKYIGFDLHGERLGCDLSDEQSGRISVNAGVVRREGNEHILILDIRCPVTCDMDEVVARVAEKAESAGGRVEKLPSHRPVYIEPDSELVRVLTEIYREETKDSTPPMVIGGGTYARAMDNIVAFGPELPGREHTEHQVNERVAKADLLLAAEIYEKALIRLAT